MKTTQTTTTNRPNLDRIAKAYRRPTTADYINRYKWTHRNPYERPQKAVYSHLRAKIRDSGLPMYFDLQYSQRADQNTANEYKLVVALDMAEEQAEKITDQLKDLANRSECMTLDEDTRNQALKDHKEKSRELARLKTLIKSLTEKLESQQTFSNRQDLVQVAYIQDRKNYRNPAPITLSTIYYLYHLPLCHTFYYNIAPQSITLDEWAKLQAKANFSALCKAVKDYLTEQTTGYTMDKISTVSHEITEEQYNEWLIRYGDRKVSQPRKRTRDSDCYITVKADPEKGKYYKVFHYLTIAPVTYIEHYTTTDKEGNTTYTIDKYIKHKAKESDPSTPKTARGDNGRQALTDFMREYNKVLTKTQRNLLTAFMLDESEQEETRAKEEYISTHADYTIEQAEEYAFKCRLAKAFDLIATVDPKQKPIDNQNTRNQTMSRLYEKIRPTKGATAKSQTEPTPIIIPSDYKTTAEHTYKHTAQTIADIIKWHSTADNEKAIQWQTHEQAEESRAEEQSRAKEQTAESKINNGTLWAEYTAHFSELRYKLHQANPNRQTLDRLTPKEIEHYYTKLNKHREKVRARAEHQAKAEQMQKARAEQDRKTAYYKTVVFNYRHEITAEDRKVFDRLPFKAQVQKALAEKTA